MSLICANVHNHHFIIRATQFGPELQVLLVGDRGMGDPAISA